MLCQSCHFPNRDDARFCERCGQGLALACRECGAAYSATSRFCPGCGAPVAAGSEATRESGLPQREAERRQLTILFCDMVGYTALSATLDPEDLRDLIRHYQNLVAAEIRRYEGSVAQFVGDAVMAYFGFPTAHEDDPVRAVLAGLGIIDAVRGLRTPSADKVNGGSAVRVGIATGEVVVGDVVGEGSGERWAVIGETPNLAARLQSIAERNSVVISSRTKHLAGGAFEYVSVGWHELKGISPAVEVWRVNKKTLLSRFDAVRGKVLTPMVARDAELALLDRCWRQARTGNGQVVMVHGEPGVGKSRVMEFFCAGLKDEPHLRLRYQCSPYHANSAWHPLIAHIEHAARFSGRESARQKCRKLEALFEIPEAERATSVPLIASLLSIPCGELYPRLMLDPSQQREMTLRLLLARFHTLAAKTPLVCTVEDAHWIDPSTLDLLQTLASEVETLPVLLIVTCRPEFKPTWKSASVTDVRLRRFDERGIREIVAGVSGKRALPAGVVSQIVVKADGVPLFAEELTKTVLDADVAWAAGRAASPSAPADLAIPATLLDSLTARLDRLPEEKSVAQLAAAVGRRFSLDLLAAVADLPRPKLIEALRRLEEADIIYECRPLFSETFEFKHALIQEAAYQSQLKSARRMHHKRIADALEERFPAIALTQPEVVAHHYAEAECVTPALEHWQAAGMRAIEQCANVEAARHLEQALRLVSELPDPGKRKQAELAIQLARGTALTALQGFASPAVEEAYARALLLSREVGTDRHRFAASFGLWRIVITRPALNEAKALAAQLQDNAERLGASEMMLTAHGTVGITSLFRGELLPAEQSFAKVIALYDPVAHRALTVSAGLDPGLTCMMYSALVWWLRGDAERALGQYAEALERARALGHAFTLAYTLHLAAVIEQCAGNLAMLTERAIELERLTAERNFAQLHASTRVFLNYVASLRGGAASALQDMERGIAEYEKSSGLHVPYFKAMFADACAKNGNIERGLAALGEAMALADKTGVRWCRSELFRLKGELLSRRSRSSAREVNGLLVRAIAIARQQGAASLEKRARESLLGRQGGSQPAEATRMG